MSHVTGIVLAAGRSSRMGELKLLLDYHGKPLLRHVLESALQSSLDEVIVVLGNEQERIQGSIDLKGCSVVLNPDFHNGQCTSLKAGIEAVAKNCEAALFLLGDQPLVDFAVIDAIVGKYKETRASIVVPVFAGKRGNPVLFARPLFPMILKLEGDTGARKLLTEYKEFIKTVPIGHAGIHLDVDTWEDYLALQRRHLP